MKYTLLQGNSRSLRLAAVALRHRAATHREDDPLGQETSVSETLEKWSQQLMNAAGSEEDRHLDTFHTRGSK